MKWFLSKLNIVLISMIFLLSGCLYISRIQLRNRTSLLSRSINNSEFYQNALNDLFLKNNTLQLTIDLFKNTNDSLINKMRGGMLKAKIDNRKVKQISGVSVQLKDSAQSIIRDTVNLDFEKKINLNDMTLVFVSRRDSILKVKLDILSDMYIYLKTKRVYINNYSNFFKRLLKLDFKKYTKTEYDIVVTNPLIKVKDSRVIEIK